jgi:TolB-like protein
MTAEDPQASSNAATQSGVESLARIWARVKEHKVIQWGLAYLAAALALAHGTELVAQAFEWPHIVPRIVVVLLALGLPIVVTLAWYHGHKGARRVSGAEAAIISLLMVICAVLLVVFVRPTSEQGARAPETAISMQPLAGQATSAPAPAQAVLSPSGKPRIAILPFENLSPDPNNAFFTDGLHEEIMSALANAAPGLDVISRTTMMLYRAAPKPVADIAKELGATYVLEGSVRREGDQVRLTLQLIDAQSDDHIWSQNYDRKLVSAMTLQSEVAGEVASQLSVQIAPQIKVAGPPTQDAEAYDLFLKARLASGRLIATNPVEQYQEVEDLLTHAIARDPNFALAYVERFNLHLLLFILNYDASETRLKLARADLEAAKRLAGNDASVLAAESEFAAFGERDYDRALALFAEARRRGLADPNLLQRGASLLNLIGRHDEALALYARLVPLDPGNNFLLITWVLDLVAAHQPEEAARVIVLERARLAQIQSAGGDFGTGQLVKYWFAGQSDSASADALLRSPINIDNDAVLAFGSYLRNQGRYREITARLDKLNTNSIRITLLGNLPALGIGRIPIADLRGWADLLLGDQDAAARDGRAVNVFVGQQEAAEWNAWYLRLLAADAQLFSGDRAGAVNAAHEALAMKARSPDLYDRTLVKYLAAQVLAWSRAEDEAMDLLEELGQPTSALAPALIARDPVFTVPLANNARFQALKANLEAQMAATRLE